MLSLCFTFEYDFIRRHKTNFSAETTNLIHKLSNLYQQRRIFIHSRISTKTFLLFSADSLLREKIFVMPLPSFCDNNRIKFKEDLNPRLGWRFSNGNLSWVACSLASKNFSLEQRSAVETWSNFISHDALGRRLRQPWAKRTRWCISSEHYWMFNSSLSQLTSRLLFTFL